MELVYTPYDISLLLEVDLLLVTKWIQKGLLDSFKTPEGGDRVRQSDLRAFLASQRMPVPEELGASLIRILVIDDEEAILNAMKRSFRSHTMRFDVRYTLSSIEALLMVADWKPHALVVDLHMPDFDGLELCRRIRGSDRHCTIKLINMTSRYDESVAERALAAGADRCLPKPVSPDDLMRIFDGPGDEHRASSSSSRS